MDKPLPAVDAEPYDWPYSGGSGWLRRNTAFIIIDMQVGGTCSLLITCPSAFLPDADVCCQRSIGRHLHAP